MQNQKIELINQNGQKKILFSRIRNRVQFICKFVILLLQIHYYHNLRFKSILRALEKCILLYNIHGKYAMYSL